MPRSLRKFRLYRFFLMNPRPAHLFMICSNIKLTGPAESIEIESQRIHEWNQRDSTMAVQRKLEILADANPAHGIVGKRCRSSFSETIAPRRICSMARG
jgi:hypothetical protein